MSLLSRVRDVARAPVLPPARPTRRHDGGGSRASRADGPLPFDAEGLNGWGTPSNGSNLVANFLTGLGLLGTDNSVANRFVRPRRLSWSEYEALHTDAIGRRIAELPGHEATREGYQVRPVRPKDAAAAQGVVDRLTSRSDDLHLLSRLCEARWRRRTFGSCLVVAGTEDCFVRDAADKVIGADFSRKLQRGSEVLWLRTFDARWYRVRETYGEGHPLCGQPRLYEVRGWDRPQLDYDYERLGARVPSTANVQLVHASRVWRDAEPEGWSIFDGLARDLARFLSGARGAEDALTAMGVPVYEIKDLKDKLARDEAGVRAQIQAAHQAKSMVNALITEMGEERFDWRRLQLGGVSDVVNSLGYVLSAATGIPMTLLFGMSPGGFSGGESEERNWLNYVRSVQRELGHGVQFVLDLLLGEMGVEPDAFPFAVEWNKLVVLDDLQTAQLRNEASQYWSRIITDNIVKPSEVRTSAFGGEGWSLDVSVTAATEEKTQANLGAAEATATLALLQAYYEPGSVIPAGAARAYLAAIDPSLAGVAATMIEDRPPAPVLAPAVLGVGAAGAGAPAMLGAGSADPSLDDPAALAEPVVPERAPDSKNTWLAADEIAGRLGCTASFVRRMWREGQVASRKGTGSNGARQYALEHALEAVEGVTTARVGADPSPKETDDVTDEDRQDETGAAELETEDDRPDDVDHR